jgi:dTDP-4-dehydrorhamnose reductase
LRILVVGADGFLGSYVFESCKGNPDIIATGTSRHNSGFEFLDITDPKMITDTVARTEPDCIINCAAMASVDECERQPALAQSINAVGPGILAEAAQKIGSRLVHVSTDAVFDGLYGGYLEDSPPHPINIYALTKLEGEKNVANYNQDYVILRTNFYGLDPNGTRLLNWILSNLISGSEMIGFGDVVFNPLWVQDLAKCTVELARSSYAGILHCVGDETLSKYEFIKKIAHILGYKDVHVKESLSSNLPTLVAKRPTKTYLSNTKMHMVLKTKIHTLEQVLQDPSFDIYRKKEAGKI